LKSHEDNKNPIGFLSPFTQVLPIEGIRIRRQERKKKDVEKEARKAITSLTPKNNFLLESGDGNDSIANPVDQAVRRADKRRQSDT